MTVVRYSPNSSNPVSFPLKQNTNNGITTSKNGMPKKFNVADGGSSFSMGRNVYLNTTRANENNIVSLTDEYKKKRGCSCNNQKCSCSSGKLINVQSSDQYIQRKKNQAIGKGSMPGQTNDNGSTELSFKTQSNSNRNTVNSARRRCRNSGYIIPAKVSARPVNC